ncbi:MAG: ABC transporter permease subunit [Clostridia bacterium]|nr:ABC transporter permease subunit [Clostridia bacterium]MBR6479130.1 ABC transporter permease subunit [Clostridia bacterium]MBR6511886.1 ABC transporter permease subunit [Clostridia bacterium]
MENNKKEFFLVRWIRRLIFPQKELDIYTEEQMQSPMRLVVKNYFSKPMSVISLIVFIIIALFVFIAPHFVYLDLGEQDSTLVNIAPGYNMLKYPKALEQNGVQDISVGNNYSIGVDKEGHVYVWGKSKVTKIIDLSKLPNDVQKADIVGVAAGADHALAYDKRGTIYAWGSDRLNQCTLPKELQQNNLSHTMKIAKIAASNQFSGVMTEDGRFFVWGNSNFVDFSYNAEEYDGHVVDFALTNNSFVLLLDDGRVVRGGEHASTTVQKVPEAAEKGVVALASTTNSVAALKDDGSIVMWGAYTKNENKIPKFSSKVVKLVGGRYHYTALLEDGTVVGWGDNKYKQTTVPEKLQGAEITALYAGSFQNYAVTADGNVTTWGLKGFPLGTDNLGRNVYSRLVNGGKMTMTIGALSVVIEIIIGVILGGIAGYFGGVVDMVVMRIAEVVSSMPFIPFAMILSAVMGTKVSIEQRMYIIMVILGILSWPGLCRLVRAQMFSQREMEYVVAAKALGVKESKIIFSHIIPNVMSVCLVTITLAFGTAMLTESTLSYLGFGVPLPTPTWGNMLTNANNSIIIQNYWWNWVFVGTIFGVACICINLIGDGLRDALDPKTSGR